MTVVPSTIDHEGIQAAAREHQALAGRQREEEHALDKLKRRRAVAVEEDRRMLAEALRGGKAEPASKVEAVDVEVAASQRRVEALAMAARSAHDDLVAVAHEHRAVIAAAVDVQVAERAAALAEQVEALSGAYDELGLAIATRGWLATFPGRPFNPAGGGLGTVRGLRGVNHEDYPWQTVVEALREVCRRAAPDVEEAA